MQPMLPIRSTLILLTLVASAAAGCRDVRDGTRRISDHDVLGGARLTRADVEAGWYVSTNSDLTSLQTRLRETLGATISLFGNVTLAAAGTVQTYNPTAVDTDGSLGTRNFATTPTPATVYDISLATLQAEFRTLCEDEYLGAYVRSLGGGDCELIKLGSAQDFVDQIILRLESDDISVTWEPANTELQCNEYLSSEYNSPGECGSCSRNFECPEDGVEGVDSCIWKIEECTANEDCEGGDPFNVGICAVEGYCTRRAERYCYGDRSSNAPVMALRLPFDVETTSDPGSTFLAGGVHVRHATLEYRLQPLACVDSDDYGNCTRSGRTVAEAYTLPRSPAGDAVFSDVGLDVRATGRKTELEIEFIPGLCGLVAPVCAGLHALANDQLNAIFDRLAKSTGRLVDAVMSAPRLPTLTGFPAETVRGVCDDAMDAAPIPLPCPLSNAAINAVADNLKIDVSKLFVRLPGTSDGDIGEVVQLGGANGAWADGTILALANGGDVVGATLDVTAFTTVCGSGYAASCTGDEPDAKCDVCDFCTSTINLGSGPVPVTSLDPTLAALCNFSTPVPYVSTSPTASFFTIPASPGLAMLLGGMPMAATQLRRTMTRPVEEYIRLERTPVRYTDTVLCPSAETPALCPDGAFGAVFHILADRDGDGLPDHLDNCPDVPNPDQEDDDDDNLGNACDDCPFTRSTDNRDRDGDGTPDVCDCDIDGDKCLNELLVAPFMPIECGVFGDSLDERPLICDRDPDGSCQPINTDGDVPPVPDDCDDDDDDDGVPDSLDNCRVVPNPDQKDENGDGRGDACDPLCNGSGLAICSDHPSSFFGVPELDFWGHIPGWDPYPWCIADGPGCMFWFSRDAGINIAAGGDLVHRLRTGVLDVDTLAGTMVAIPDLDGDGIEDLLIGSPTSRACDSGECIKGAGAIRAISSVTGEHFYTLSPFGEGAHAGASMLRVGGSVYVGAPSAQDAAGMRTGAVVRLDFSDGGFEPTIGDVWFGARKGEAFGTSLAPIAGGEYGVAAIYIGAPGAKVGKLTHAGRVYTYSLDGASMGTIDGFVANGRFGDVLVAASDAMAGKGALLVGMPMAYDKAGAIALYDTDGNQRWMFKGNPGEQLGTSISAPADFNLDGQAISAVGAPGAGDGIGAVWLVNGYGKIDLLTKGDGHGQIGRVVSAPGDVTGDGIVDLLIGIKGIKLPGVGQGATAIMAGVGWGKQK